MICVNCGGTGIKTSRELFRHQDECYSRGWQEVVNLRLAGEYEAADRKTRKLLGVNTPMTEEDKQKLKEYYEEHKEEIKIRAKAKRQAKKRQQELMKSGSTSIKRKKN